MMRLGLILFITFVNSHMAFCDDYPGEEIHSATEQEIIDLFNRGAPVVYGGALVDRLPPGVGAEIQSLRLVDGKYYVRIPLGRCPHGPDERVVTRECDVKLAKCRFVVSPNTICNWYGE